MFYAVCIGSTLIRPLACFMQCALVQHWWNPLRILCSVHWFNIGKTPCVFYVVCIGSTLMKTLRILCSVYWINIDENLAYSMQCVLVQHWWKPCVFYAVCIGSTSMKPLACFMQCALVQHWWNPLRILCSLHWFNIDKTPCLFYAVCISSTLTWNSSWPGIQ